MVEVLIIAAVLAIHIVLIQGPAIEELVHIPVQHIAVRGLLALATEVIHFRVDQVFPLAVQDFLQVPDPLVHQRVHILADAVGN